MDDEGRTKVFPCAREVGEVGTHQRGVVAKLRQSKQQKPTFIRPELETATEQSTSIYRSWSHISIESCLFAWNLVKDYHHEIG